MGKLLYGNVGTAYEMDDRTLSHLKIAITGKLRRHESFLVSWDVPHKQGGGRVSLWMSREIPLGFTFAGSRPPVLNQVWIECLRRNAGRTGGMQLISEREAMADSGQPVLAMA
jgi:hypothetical protein